MVLVYAIVGIMGALHHAGYSDLVVGMIAVPIALFALAGWGIDCWSRMGRGALVISEHEIWVERKGRKFSRFSREQLQIECGAWMTNGGSGTGQPGQDAGGPSWLGPAIRLGTPIRRRKMTVVCFWSSLKASHSATSHQTPFWAARNPWLGQATNSFRKRTSDIRLQGEGFERLQQALRIGASADG